MFTQRLTLQQVFPRPGAVLSRHRHAVETAGAKVLPKKKTALWGCRFFSLKYRGGDTFPTETVSSSECEPRAARAP